MSTPDMADPGYQRRVRLAQRRLDSARATLDRWRKWRNGLITTLIIISPAVVGSYYLANVSALGESTNVLGTIFAAITTVIAGLCTLALLFMTCDYFDRDIGLEVNKALHAHEDVLADDHDPIDTCTRCGGTGLS